MLKNKRSPTKDANSQNSPKKIKMDFSLKDSNCTPTKKDREKKDSKIKKKEENSAAEDSDDTISNLSNSGSEDSSGKTIEKSDDESGKEKNISSDNSSTSDKNESLLSRESSSKKNDDEFQVNTDSNDSGKLLIDEDEKKKKEMQTVATLTCLSLPSDEELKYRSNLKNSEKIEDYHKMFTCTKCNFNFNKSIKVDRKISIHPLLGVLMCKKCCNYYGDGDFSLDSDNEDKYCRWCGEGGTIFSCSKCICGFCKKCVTKHFGRKIASQVEFEDDWLCYFCNMKPLWELRFICSLAQKECVKLQKNQNSNIERRKKKVIYKKGNTSTSSESSDSDSGSNQDRRKKNFKQKSLSKNKSSDSGSDSNQDRRKKILKQKSLSKNKSTRSKDMYVSTSDESDNENKNRLKVVTSTPKKLSNGDLGGGPFNSKKQKVIKELENILKLAEYQMSFGSSWCTKKLKVLSKVEDFKNESNLKKECKKIKWFISTLCSYLVGFSNSIDSMEKSLDKKVPGLEEKISTPDATYASILKFLDFTSNLVKIFDQKKIDLEYVLNSKLYEDENVLGLQKKKQKLSPVEDEPKRNEADDPVERNLELLFNTCKEKIKECTEK